jgi:hypothetical protein
MGRLLGDGDTVTANADPPDFEIGDLPSAEPEGGQVHDRPLCIALAKWLRS